MLIMSARMGKHDLTDFDKAVRTLANAVMTAPHAGQPPVCIKVLAGTMAGIPSECSCWKEENYA